MTAAQGLPGLPRLLYLGDVPVEASHHGSALLHRLLGGYPPASLFIMESRMRPSDPRKRIAHVVYAHLPDGRKRWLDSRLHSAYSSWLMATAASRARTALRLLGPFRPQAIVTVAHGHAWLSAAALARRLALPLHMIIHDDWPGLALLLPAVRSWMQRRFGEVYRLAATRLCVSPFMAEEYERRYGVRGSVLYPSRAADCPLFDPAQQRDITGELVIGYGGNSSPDILAALKDVAAALAPAEARMEVFGPFPPQAREALLRISPAVSFRGMVPYTEMMERLHASSDVLLVPMSFDAGSRSNMVVSFPSKLADYTAIGRPLLTYGPAYSSAVRWCRLFGVDEVVDVQGRDGIASALRRLRDDRDRRARLATRAREAGDDCFDARVARVRFLEALGRPQ